VILRVPQVLLNIGGLVDRIDAGFAGDLRTCLRIEVGEPPPLLEETGNLARGHG
jgi:hypothetical protein